MSEKNTRRASMRNFWVRYLWMPVIFVLTLIPIVLLHYSIVTFVSKDIAGFISVICLIGAGSISWPVSKMLADRHLAKHEDA